MTQTHRSNSSSFKVSWARARPITETEALDVLEHQGSDPSALAGSGGAGLLYKVEEHGEVFNDISSAVEFATAMVDRLTIAMTIFGFDPKGRVEYIHDLRRAEASWPPLAGWLRGHRTRHRQVEPRFEPSGGYAGHKTQYWDSK